MAEIDFSGFYSESEESKADKWGPEEDRLSSEDEGDGSGRTSDKEIDGESAGEMHSEEDLPKSQPGGVSHDQSGGGSEHVAEGRPEEDVHQEEGPIGERGGSGGQPRDGAHGTGSRKEQAAEGEVPEARGAPEETGGGEQRTAAEPGGTHGDPNRFYKYKKRYFSLMKSGQRRFQFPVPMQQISFLMSPHGRFHVRSTQSLRENPAMQELIPEIADIMAARYELKKTEANVVKGARARRRLARQAEKSNRPAPDPQKPQSTSSLLKKRARRIAGTDAYKSHIESVMEGVDGEFCSRDSCPQSHAELGEAAPCFKIRRALQLPDNLPLLKNVGLYNTAELKVFVSTFQAFEVLNPVDQAAEDGRGEPPQPEVAADPPRRTKGLLKLTVRSNAFNKNRGVQPKSRMQVHHRRLSLEDFAKCIVQAGGVQEFKNQNGFESFIKSREGLGFEDDELLEEELESVLARLREVEKEYLRDFVAEYLRQIGQAVSYVETSSDESSFSESSNKEAARTKSGEECNAGGIPDRGSVSVGSEVSLGSDMSEGELLSLRADMTVEEQQVLDGGLKRKGHSRLPEASSRMRRPTEGSEKAVPDGVRGEGPDKGDVAREPPLQEEGGGEVREQRGGQPDDPPSVVEPFFASPETAEARGMSPAVKESGAGTDSREDVFERANGPQEGEPETAARGATVLGGGPNDCGTNAPPPEETVRTAGNAAANTERGADVRTQSTPEAISPGEAARGEAVPDGGDANACRNAPLPVGTGRTAGNTATVSDEELGFRRPPGHAKETGGATCGTAVPEGGAKERQNAPPQEERSKVTGDVAATLGGGPRVHSQSTPQGRRASWVARGTTVSEGAPNELQTPPPQEESDKATGDAAATLGGGPRLQSQSTPQGGGAGGVARGAAVSEGGPNERQNAPLQEERGKSTGDAAADFRGGARVRSRSTPKGGGSGKVARGTAILEGGARPPVDPSTTAGHTAADSLAGGKANVCDRTNPQAKEPGGAASNPAAVAEGGASEGEADGANLRRGSRKRKQTNRAVDGAKRRGVDMTEAGRFVDSEDVFYAGDTIVLDEDRVVRGGEYDRLKRLEQLAIGRKKRGAAPRKQRKIARDELVKLRVSSAAHPDPDMFKTTTDNKVYARVDGEWEYLWNTSMAIRRQVALLNGLNVEGLSDLEICYALRQLGDRMFFWSHGIKI